MVDGRYDAWVERDTRPGASRLRFVTEQVVRTTTTGSICNGLRTVTVGAYDAHGDDHALTSFSSCGPTADGRGKPDVLAPGHRVLVACSAPTSPPADDRPLSTRQSGTSHAAPAVAGVLAAMFEVLGPVPVSTVRHLLLGSCTPFTGPGAQRAGSGYLNPREAFAAARARSAAHAPTSHHPRGAPHPSTPEESTMSLLAEPLTQGGAPDPFALPPADPAGDVRTVLDALGVVPATWCRHSSSTGRRRCGTGSRGACRRSQARTTRFWARCGRPARARLPRRGWRPGRPTGVRRAGHACHGVVARMGRGARPSGRYSLVVEPGRDADDPVARRVADPAGVCPRDQAVLRLVAVPPAPAPAPTHPAEGDGETVDRHGRPYVMWYQAELNRLAGESLVVDGAAGPLTRAAVIRFQRGAGIGADGAVGPITEAALMRAGAVPPPGSSLAPPVPVPPAPLPFPVPPVPVPVPPVPSTALAALESRYFPPARHAGRGADQPRHRDRAVHRRVPLLSRSWRGRSGGSSLVTPGT